MKDSRRTEGYQGQGTDEHLDQMAIEAEIASGRGEWRELISCLTSKREIWLKNPNKDGDGAIPITENSAFRKGIILLLEMLQGKDY